MSFRSRSQIAADLKAVLVASGIFKDVRRAAITSYEQLFKIIPEISRLPAAVVCIGSGETDADQMTRTVSPGIVVIDSLVGDQDSRAGDIWDLVDRTEELFLPAANQSMTINGVLYTLKETEPVVLAGSQAAYLITLDADASRD